MALIRICNNCPICLEDECGHTDQELEAYWADRQEDERVNPRPGSSRFIGPLPKPIPYMMFVHPDVAEDFIAKKPPVDGGKS